MSGSEEEEGEEKAEDDDDDARSKAAYIAETVVGKPEHEMVVKPRPSQWTSESEREHALPLHEAAKRVLRKLRLDKARAFNLRPSAAAIVARARDAARRPRSICDRL